jgi:hypothetical protein
MDEFHLLEDGVQCLHLSQLPPCQEKKPKRHMISKVC